jgi:hypothetical protein
MAWKDKLEIGLKEDAPHRKDNLPASEVHGPELPPGSPEIPLAHVSGAAPAEPTGRPGQRKPYRVVPVRATSKPEK